MATLKKYNLQGKQLGDVEIDARLADAELKTQAMKDYLVALRTNARQWSANTKGRSEIARSKRKPHPQKGTGRARQGKTSAPQYRGGGVVFGPKPKFDMHVRINKKERRAVILGLIAEHVRKNSIHVLESTDMDAPRTKDVAAFINEREFGKRVLFLGEGSYQAPEEGAAPISVRSTKHQNLARSVSNLPKVEFALARNISGYDVILANDIVVTEDALNEIIEWLI